MGDSSGDALGLDTVDLGDLSAVTGSPEDRLLGDVVEGVFIEHLATLHRKTSNDEDVVVVITGAERVGKSGLAYIAALILHAFLRRPFDPETQVHWSTRSYKASAEGRLPKRYPIWHDELVRGGASYNFMTPENKDFADFLTVCGYLNLFHMLIMPSKRWISPIIKEHRAWYQWHVVKRFRRHAVAKVYQLRDADGQFDRPRYLFSFTYPKPSGPLWKRILKMKAEFGGNVAQGTVDVAELFKVEKTRMAGALRALLVRRGQVKP
jgi:hypothetical protein